MKKDKVKFHLVLLVLIMSSCSWIMGVKKLGPNLYYEYPLIFRTETDNYKDGGACIIPPTILEIRKDEKAVIVLTSNGKHEIKYWLIDKTEESERLKEIKADSSYWGYHKYSNVYGPLDSIDFFKLKINKGVTLKW